MALVVTIMEIGGLHSTSLYRIADKQPATTGPLRRVISALSVLFGQIQCLSLHYLAQTRP